MKVRLLVQDPSADNVTYAIEAIGAAAEGALQGQIIVAFATVDGVDLLLDHENIRKLTRGGSLDLIVGIDAITNRATLERLLDVVKRRPGLRPSVFWNSTSGLFHPKIYRFWNRTRETWVVGSGNLTPRGLRDSFEVFSVLEGRPAAMEELRRPLEQFLADHAKDIREIDAAALTRAARNRFTRPILDIEPPIDRPVRRPRWSRSKTPREPDRALIAELPKGGARWQQANFDGATVESFFGIEPTPKGRQQELFFNEVDRSGKAVSEEVRRFTYTLSKNWRVQLAARNGEQYPEKGRPIAAFREVKPRHFVYQLLLPGEQGYAALRSILDKHKVGDVRRFVTTVTELRLAWPRSGLLASENLVYFRML